MNTKKSTTDHLIKYPWETDFDFYLRKQNYLNKDNDDFIADADYLDEYPECNHPPLEDIL